MDQSELGKRVGVSRTTISSIERGIGVNSKSLFNIVSFLGLADVIQAAVNERSQLIEPIDHVKQEIIVRNYLIISKAFVFIDGLEDKLIVCGVVTLDTQKRYGEFRYGKSYLLRDDAFPLDPLNLPLNIHNKQSQRCVWCTFRRRS
jgi:DNA-binding XRE family transcriptional regulator